MSHQVRVIWGSLVVTVIRNLIIKQSISVLRSGDTHELILCVLIF